MAYVQRANAGADLDDWCRREKQITDGRCVFFGGVHSHVTRQLLFGVYSRSRRGARTRLDDLQRLVDRVRWLQAMDLRALQENVLAAPLPHGATKLLNSVMVTVEYGDRSPDDFRRADVWPGVVFGKGGAADFRPISQGWLRDITRAWLGQSQSPG
jgi:hypothetical protein